MDTGSGPSPRLAAALVLGLTVAACTAGDFGRPRPGVWNDVIGPELGFWAATARGEAASPFHLTDDEEQLRDRAWRFVMPAYARNYFDIQVSDLAYKRILPVEAQSSAISDYFNGLTGVAYRSAASRYNRLAEDAHADRLLLSPFRGNAWRVVAADRVRMRAVDASPLVPPDQRGPAFARVVENEGVILWVCERIRFRMASYRYALANLVVEMPSREAIRAERSIMALEQEAGPLCKIELIGVFGGGAPPDKPVVYKG
ncbi:hypothetical protein [Bosea sp. BK604]|uniref:hypothetical protein n=1 Tax=Bosea sp. BK604 TaxID=2512180 RepID=UPI001050CE1F|nr:hypothetical protein [Bosea sp. BK604]TCR61181.1 hypothetical protein EV560_114135 [Bosea sp. BK604]